MSKLDRRSFLKTAGVATGVAVVGGVPAAAAAATESRVFPSFAYDPSAGDTWADRFTLACNPQPELDWPVHRVAYQDDALQAVAVDVPFTAADFWACDARLVPHLALAGDDGEVVPFAELTCAPDQLLAQDGAAALARLRALVNGSARRPW